MYTIDNLRDVKYGTLENKLKWLGELDKAKYLGVKEAKRESAKKDVLEAYLEVRQIKDSVEGKVLMKMTALELVNNLNTGLRMKANSARDKAAIKLMQTMKKVKEISYQDNYLTPRNIRRYANSNTAGMAYVIGIVLGGMGSWLSIHNGQSPVLPIVLGLGCTSYGIYSTISNRSKSRAWHGENMISLAQSVDENLVEAYKDF